jgi:hypothetical protein
MLHISEDQKVLLNRLMDIIAHDDSLLEQLAAEMEIESKELDELVNTIEF